MTSYTAPLRDMRFALYELADFATVTALPGCGEVTQGLVDPILEAGGVFCAEVLAPINRSGDEEGCHFENGVVRTPAGFREAYAAFCRDGWPALHADPAYGGQGLPKTVSLMFEEMICSANLSFGMYPGLSHGAYEALRAHGTPDLQQLYLPKLVSGEWSGTMCLTEPQCGTDLGLLRTRAEPAEDGSFRVTGTKIFISAGEHDLTGNILHLVLARLPGAPAGVRGISLFLVPKFVPAEDGRPGVRNAVAAGAIEHKMGIKASSTCVMNFDGAQGWIVGQPHRGLTAMFTMMNAARLSVGIQGLGVAEVSYQNAVAYARDRLQGRALGGVARPDLPADPILVHPDVRRMLLTMRAGVEGCRALGVRVAVAQDIAMSHADADVRAEADDYVALMTPIVKAYFTDMGWEATVLGMQVLGGHGYIREHGMEQFVRDARIAQIYEGTNGIQALDLVGRKMSAHAGRYLRRFFHPVSAYIEAKQGQPALAEFVDPLAKAFVRLQQATAALAAKGIADPFEAGAAASDYLRLFALVALAQLWAEAAEISVGKTEDFYRAKLATARFFMAKILPQSSSLFSTIMAGGGSLKEFEDGLF
ncbi:MAG: acyl-CoA dehydrogenase C-terminal domain-containing protein [Acetobacteraceae bacterium]|nr:acyl-CoA dehydrogenase C-terminal domain-containing protein [Acetobacteraceae bacterium]